MPADTLVLVSLVASVFAFFAVTLIFVDVTSGGN